MVFPHKGTAAHLVCIPSSYRNAGASREGVTHCRRANSRFSDVFERFRPGSRAATRNELGAASRDAPIPSVSQRRSGSMRLPNLWRFELQSIAGRGPGSSTQSRSSAAASWTAAQRWSRWSPDRRGGSRRATRTDRCPIPLAGRNAASAAARRFRPHRPDSLRARAATSSPSTAPGWQMRRPLARRIRSTWMWS